jgi:hypothetical protein
MSASGGRRGGSARRSGKARAPAWAQLDDESLLDLRFCELGLDLENARLQAGMRQLDAELAARGIAFRPHYWLADEWFSPDGVPGIAIPFYLAHPRLAALERRQMHEVEGGNWRWLMRILRHEAGHAVDTAYGLRRRRAWREVFGKASQRYPTRYRPRPASRRFVLHLGLWYAQSHPTEDFAETFAVWLKPRSRWRSEYRGWPAMQKLLYVDRTMGEITQLPVPEVSREQVEPIGENTRTLRQHYRRRQGRYPDSASRVYDLQLHRIFPRGSEQPSLPSAAGFLRESATRLRREMVRHAGVHPYLASHVLRTAVERARRLDLRVRADGAGRDTLVLAALERIILDTLLRNREDFAL